MYDIDREAFAAFLTELRKEKGLTQKALAAKLYVSDKAVSKWERGLSLPDISLLIPLAALLNVTVTELLEGKRMNSPEAKSPEQVEELVKTALSLGEERMPVSGGRTCCTVFLAALIIAALEWGVFGVISNEMKVLEGLSIGFGCYFWLFALGRLPNYYDENKVGTYSHGPIRMNIPGVNFNNRNWPHIVKCMRVWALVTMLTVPLLTIPLRIVDVMYGMDLDKVVLVVYLGLMFASLYWAGRRCES